MPSSPTPEPLPLDTPALNRSALETLRAALGLNVHREGSASGAAGEASRESPGNSSSSLATYSLATGSRVLDDFLSAPLQGNRTGILVEWFVGTGSTLGAGGDWLALAAAWGACGSDRMLVVLDREGSWSERFYPPAAAALGVDLSRMLVLRPQGEQDAIWCMDQALRCRGVGAVWAEWNFLDDRVFRRLQLAAEHGHALGMLVRSVAHRGRPSWAHVQLLVESAPNRRQEHARHGDAIADHAARFLQEEHHQEEYCSGAHCYGESRAWLGGRRWRVELLRHRNRHWGSESIRGDPLRSDELTVQTN